MIKDDVPQLHAFSYLSDRGGAVGRSDQWIGRSSLSNVQLANQSIANQFASSSYADMIRGVSKQSQQILETAKSIEKETEMASRRMVQVYIVDPDDQVPVDKALIYKSEPHITDLTDQELFYEIPIKSKMLTHNEYRQTILNKKVKDRMEYLEPIRIRDLSMLVITLAEFRKS